MPTLITSAELTKKALITIKQNWLNLVLSLFFIITLILTILFVLISVYAILLYLNVINVNVVFTFRLAWNCLFYLIFLIVSVLAQILIINNLFKPDLNFKENYKAVISNFWNFLGLTITIDAVFFILNLPFYGAVLLLSLNYPVLAVLSLIFGLIINIIAASYLIFSAYILIDKKLPFWLCFKESYNLAKNSLGRIILKLAVICIIVLIITNFLTLLSLQYPLFGTLLAIAIFCAIVLFVFAFIYQLYLAYKK